MAARLRSGASPVRLTTDELDELDELVEHLTARAERQLTPVPNADGTGVFVGRPRPSLDELAQFAGGTGTIVVRWARLPARPRGRLPRLGRFAVDPSGALEEVT